MRDSKEDEAKIDRSMIDKPSLSLFCNICNIVESPASLTHESCTNPYTSCLENPLDNTATSSFGALNRTAWL